MRCAWWWVAVGCSSPSVVTSDAGVDAFVPVTDAPCRAESFDYAGRFVDGPVVLAGATLAVHGDPTRTATTLSTGDFDLCAPAAASFVVDVDAPGNLGGQIVEAAPDQARGLGLPPFTRARLEAVLAGTSQTYDPAAGVVIAVQLGAVNLDVTGIAGMPLTPAGAEWAAGDAGEIVLFPNVAPGTTTLQRAADGFALAVPVVAGQITWVHIEHIEI
jgi:hypothetical protein